MAGAQSDQDRTEAATPYKLQKAHERGSVVRSAELTFAAVLLAAFACVLGLGGKTVRSASELVASSLRAIGHVEATGAAQQILAGLAYAAAQLLAPLLFVLWFSAVIAAGLQVRGVFSTEPLKPDFTRLSPSKGFERVFSMRSLFDLGRGLLKLVVIVSCCLAWGLHRLGDIVGAQALHGAALAGTSLALVGDLFGLLVALYVLFAMLDWLFNRWEFARQMRMSKREIKDEHKEREGDPRIKARLRELRIEWLRRSKALVNVKQADVLLVNPTHYAVALQYRHGDMPAPMITARGAGELAMRMRRLASGAGVPVVQNTALARALFAVPDSQAYVPEQHFHDVARILRWVFAQRGSRRNAEA